MEIENFNLEFQDLIAYLVPGFFVLLWLYYIEILDLFEEEIATFHPIVLIVGIILGSYVLGQVIYPGRVFLVGLLRHIFGDPRIELIDKSPFESKYKFFLFKIFLIDIVEFNPKSNPKFKSELSEKLEAHWGKSLINEHTLAIYMLCLKFVRHNSPDNARQIDRYNSLRNMHGAMVLPFILFLILRFIKPYSWGLWGIFFVGTLLFIRNCYAAQVDEARNVYRTFFMLRHELPSESNQLVKSIDSKQ